MFRSQKWAVSFYWNAEYVRGREERKLEKVSGGMTMNNLEWLSSGEWQSQDSLAHLEICIIHVYGAWNIQPCSRHSYII